MESYELSNCKARKLDVYGIGLGLGLGKGRSPPARSAERLPTCMQ